MVMDALLFLEKSINLLDLNHSKILNIIKKGFILFRNFKFRKEKITLFMTSLLKNMQMMLIEDLVNLIIKKLKLLMREKKKCLFIVKQVDLPSWPEIVWFVSSNSKKWFYNNM